MTPKEKAKELVKTFKFTKFSIISQNPKQCALICADEIYNSIGNENWSDVAKQSYWTKVKIEINEL